MKTLTTFFVALGLFLSTTVFAIPEESVAEKVKVAFHQNFAEATDVQWDQVDEFYFATFMLEEKQVNVAYNSNGDIVGTSQMVEFSKLPFATSCALKNQYKHFQLGQQVFEITCNGETTYYVTAANEKRLLKLKCSVDGNITVVQKTKLSKQG